MTFFERYKQVTAWVRDVNAWVSFSAFLSAVLTVVVVAISRASANINYNNLEKLGFVLIGYVSYSILYKAINFVRQMQSKRKLVNEQKHAVLMSLIDDRAELKLAEFKRNELPNIILQEIIKERKKTKELMDAYQKAKAAAKAARAQPPRSPYLDIIEGATTPSEPKSGMTVGQLLNQLFGGNPKPKKD